MTEPAPWSGEPRQIRSRGGSSSANLADVLERVLDKGVVIAGDIKINLLDIELLTVKLRLLVASVDKAKEMGIDWWENDPALSSKAAQRAERELAEENERLRERIAALEEHRAAPLEAGGQGTGGAETGPGAGEETAAPAERPAAREEDEK
ncbi:gas vesicle protein [Streptomonospora sp. S1-112]|uniref:Gas vesicle protein n=1 Tax=Streptomonospora mangrovi TaxID=2883123 RepID=A0A9X3SHI9_9ACTN|nr:gas vesicle protein [Streptomonospora mangrovi]MDA0567180.1 gas vesicle protein [Streptomonospora mangrovi]